MKANDLLAISVDSLQRNNEEEIKRVLQDMKYIAQAGFTSSASIVISEPVRRYLKVLGYRIVLCLDFKDGVVRHTICWGELTHKEKEISKTSTPDNVINKTYTTTGIKTEVVGGAAVGALMGGPVGAVVGAFVGDLL